MKHKIKSALSLLLSLAMVVTGLTVMPVVPAASLTVEAADVNKEFMSDAIELVDTSGKTPTEVLYWKGQEIELSVDVFGDKEITWTSENNDPANGVTLVENGSRSEAVKKDNVGEGRKYIQKFQIGKEAAGAQKITATVGTASLSFEFNVEKDSLQDIKDSLHNTFNDRWTGEVLQLYVVADKNAGKPVFSTSEEEKSLVEITDLGETEANEIGYFGAGSAIYRADVKINRLENALTEGTVTIKATLGSDEKSLKVDFKQSASEIDPKSITVSCNDAHEHGTGAGQISHYDPDTSTIYLDVGQYATVTGSLLGSTVDYLTGAAPAGSAKTFDAMLGATGENEGNGADFVLVVHALQATPDKSPTYVKIMTKSGQVTTTAFKIVIYKGGISNNFELYRDGEKITNDLFFDPGDTGKFGTQVTTQDAKEKVKWSVSGVTSITVNDDGTFKVSDGSNVSGTATVTATVMDTLSGKRGQTSSFGVQISKIAEPDKLELQWENGSTAASRELFVGDQPIIVKRNATRNDNKTVYYDKYKWVSTTQGVITFEDEGTNSVRITPNAKGVTNFYTYAENGKTSQMLTFTVLAPITEPSIEIQNTVNDELIAGHEYPLEAKREATASDRQIFTWTAVGSNGGAVKFVDEDGKEYDSLQANSCTLKAVSAGNVTITATPDKMGEKDPVKVSKVLKINNRIPADSVSITVDDGKTVTDNYIMFKDETKTFTVNGSAVGGDYNGQASNDVFSYGQDINVDIADVKWDSDKRTATVKPKKTGTLKLNFTNETDPHKPVISRTIEIKVKVTELDIRVQDKTLEAMTIKKGDEVALTAYTKPSASEHTDNLSWESSDPDVVKVEDGYLTALKNSDKPVKITVSAEYGDLTDSIDVSVINPIESMVLTGQREDDTSLAMDGTDVVFTNGDQVTLKAVVYPADATDTYTWNVSPANVCSYELQDGGEGIVLKPGATQGTVTVSATPNRQYANDKEGAAVTITVATKPGAIQDIKNGTRPTSESVIGSGVDIQANKSVTVYPILTDTSSYDQIKWTASEEGVVGLAAKNDKATHSCTITRLQEGKTVTVTASTTDGRTCSFEVRTGTSVEDCKLTPIADKDYDGKAYNPEIELTDSDGTKLTINKDYKVVYSKDNIAAGEKTLTVTGIGFYCGERTVTYTIRPLDLSRATISEIKDQIYSGKEITPAVVVTNENKKLGTADYTVTYADNLNAGTAKITLTGQGNYTGTAAATFVITPKDMGKIGAAFKNGNSFDYTGSAITPAMTVTDGKTEMKQGTDYTITYTNNVNVGTNTAKPTVVITGIGNYGGTKEVVFTIKKAKLAADCITLSKTDYTYNGKNRKPKVTVKDASGKTLKENTDYTVVYPTDLKSIGKKKITVTGTGNYEGRADAEYGVAEKVTVKKAAIKSVKNTKSKKATVTIKALADVDGYEISYSTSKKFTAATTKTVNAATNKQTITKLKKGKTYYFRVRAYKENSIGRTIYGKASAIKKVKIKK